MALRRIYILASDTPRNFALTKKQPSQHKQSDNEHTFMCYHMLPVPCHELGNARMQQKTHGATIIRI